MLDLGSGAGIDSLLAAAMVGPAGAVAGVDMPPAMLVKARRAAQEANADNVEFREGLLEEVPVGDAWADVIISNGVFNLVPNKVGVLAEMYRTLRPGGRLQLADILVEIPGILAGFYPGPAGWTPFVSKGKRESYAVRRPNEIVSEGDFRTGTDCEGLPAADRLLSRWMSFAQRKAPPAQGYPGPVRAGG